MYRERLIMEYTTLGETGITVSRICLGCFPFGDGEGWKLNHDESEQIIETAIDEGINFFDTANSYSNGESERILGDVVGEYGRDQFVIATKVYNQMDEENPNSGGLSRKAIEQELKKSLSRLDIDTIDLYQIHRWDYNTPIAETLRTLNEVVRRGLVRYIGASAMWAYQFATALYISEKMDLERFVTMQNHYNLVYREEEREMLPFCVEQGIGVIPFSPLARGYLTRPHKAFDQSKRGQHILSRNDDMPERIARYHDYGGSTINERVDKLAEDYGVSMAQISLAWLFQKDCVDAPIIGTTNVEHLKEAIDALSISLTTSDVNYLEEPYQPVPVDHVTGLR